MFVWYCLHTHSLPFSLARLLSTRLEFGNRLETMRASILHCFIILYVFTWREWLFIVKCQHNGDSLCDAKIGLHGHRNLCYRCVNILNSNRPLCQIFCNFGFKPHFTGILSVIRSEYLSRKPNLTFFWNMNVSGQHMHLLWYANGCACVFLGV